MSKVFFAGSFNPFTKGHADIVKRLLRIFDAVVVGIGVNIDKKSSVEDAERSVSRIKDWAFRSGLEKVVEVKSYSGITAEAAGESGCTCMARGVRNATDFDYEFAMASANRDAFGMETILIPADPALSYISSTLLRDLENHGKERISDKYIP